MDKYSQLFDKPKDICYQCQKEDFRLIKPCDNPDCEARIHEQCLKKQIEEGNDKCDKCKQNIVITKVEKFRLGICCTNTFTPFLAIIIFILGAISPGLLIFGTTVANKNELPSNNGWVVAVILVSVLSGLIGLGNVLLMGIILTDSKKDWINYARIIDVKYIKYNSLTISLILIINYVTILICHLLGFLILKFIFHYENLFNYKTFTVGFIFIILLMISLFIIWTIINCSKCLYRSSITEETVFGTKINHKNDEIINIS